MKKKIQFILNKPQLSENVGMSLRSIGCFGFENLSLINPRKIWPNEKGLKSAKHFSSLSKKVKTYKSIPEAMKDSDILIATTVRKRDFHIPSIKLQDISKLNPNKISILFGQENNGLTNKEISHANYILSIPTKSNSSLNLSHTVALIAYELSQMSFSKISSSKIVKSANAKDIEKFLSFLMKILEKRIEEHGLDKKDFKWYLDLRRYGSVPHSGFGLGIERTVAWITGIKHIRETIPFPRTISRLEP